MSTTIHGTFDLPGGEVVTVVVEDEDPIRAAEEYVVARKRVVGEEED